MAQTEIEATAVIAACEAALRRGVTFKGTPYDVDGLLKVEALLLLARCADATDIDAVVTVTDDDARYIGHCLLEVSRNR